MEKNRFKVGDMIVYSHDKSKYIVKKVGIMFYSLDYLSFDTHGNCVLRIAGTTIDYVDNNFYLASKLEKALL